jgi:hypothetical protein
MFSASTFPCPSCHEFINTSMTECKFCHAPVDAQAAMLAVEQQEKINGACNSASMIRTLAGAMWIFFFLRLIPFLGLLGWVVLGLFIVVPVRLVIWAVKYGGVKTEDVDYKRAWRNWATALVLWLLMPVVFVVLIFVVAGAAILSR